MRGIIVSILALALAGCGAASVPAPGTAAEFAPPRPVGPPPEETAYTRGIIKHDEQLATHEAQAETQTGIEAMAGAQPHENAPCGLLMEDVPDGLALVFTARQGESVQALRQRVELIATQYNDRNPGAQSLTQDLMNEKQQVLASAREQDVPGGARLVFSTHRPGEVEALRALMRWHAADLLPGISDEIGREGPCPSLPKPLMG